MRQQITDSLGQPVRIGREISQGGEGGVYEIQGDPSRCAKVWHPDKRSRERVVKLQAMCRIQPSLTIQGLPILAWPDEILYEGAEPVGYRMPKAENAIPLYNYLTQARRKNAGVNMGQENLALLAQRIALIFNALHRNSCNVGDVNPLNILVRRDNQIPIIIDIDSFQIQDPANTNQTFPSTVGNPEYQPAERDMNRPIGASTDVFGLAVITYQLLLDGQHPFMGIDPTNEQNAPAELGSRIQSGRFAHARERSWLPRPKSKSQWNSLPMPTRKSLIQALDHRQHGTARPSAQEMADALEDLAAPARSNNPTPPTQQTAPGPQPRPAPPPPRRPRTQPARPQTLAHQGAQGNTREGVGGKSLKFLITALRVTTEMAISTYRWTKDTLIGIPPSIRWPTIVMGLLNGLLLGTWITTLGSISDIAISIAIILVLWGIACVFITHKTMGRWPSDGERCMIQGLLAGLVISGVMAGVTAIYILLS